MRNLLEENLRSVQEFRKRGEELRKAKDAIRRDLKGTS